MRGGEIMSGKEARDEARQRGDTHTHTQNDREIKCNTKRDEWG